MTRGTIWKKIAFSALPLSLGNLFQQLHNTAGSLIVGNFLGSNALTVVSSSGNLILLMVGFFNGTATDTGIVITRYFGARDIGNMQRAIHITVAFGLASSLVLTVLGVLLAPQILIWMGIPVNILPQSVTHSHIYFMGSLGLVMYSISVGIPQAVGNSRHPLDCLIIPSTINIVLDIVLIVIFHMGVGSAAFVTILSQSVSIFLCTNRLLRTKDSYRLPLRKTRFHKDMLVLIIHYGLSDGLQDFVITITNVVAQSNINDFGGMAMIGCGAYSKIEGFAFLPTTSFTMTLTTFVGQSLGACQYKRAKRSAKFGMLCSMAIAEMTGIVIFLGTPLLTAAFNNDPQVIMFETERAGTPAMSFSLLIYPHYISAILRGAGKSMISMIAMLLFWRVVQVIFSMVMIYFLNDIAVIYWVYSLTWSLGSVAFFLYYRKVNWMHAFETV